MINTFAVLIAVVLLRPHLQCEESRCLRRVPAARGAEHFHPSVHAVGAAALIFSLGLFMIVINAGLLYLVSAMMSVFKATLASRIRLGLAGSAHHQRGVAAVEHHDDGPATPA